MIGDNYMRAAFHLDRMAIRALEQQIDEILDMYRDFRPTGAEKGWPYSLVDQQIVRSEPRYSFSTNAMIVFAVAAGAALLDKSVLMPVQRSRWKQEYGITFPDVVTKALDDFSSEMARTEADWAAKDPAPEPSVLTQSGTFGLNDPFTFTTRFWSGQLLLPT